MKRIKETNRLLAENLVRSIMKDYEACGIAAAIIDKNGVTQYEKFWGSKELGIRREAGRRDDLWSGICNKILYCFGNYADGGAGNLKFR